MVDDLQLLKDKLVMWQTKLQEAEVELKDIIRRRSEAAAMGDLRENAAFQMADEDAGTQRVRIDEVKKIISEIEKEMAKKSKGKATA